MTDPLDLLPPDLAAKMRVAKDMTAVRCPTCGAGVGHFCVDIAGRPLTTTATGGAALVHPKRRK
jgi:hypothetical protein